MKQLLLSILIMFLMTGMAICDERILFTNLAIEMYGYSDKLVHGDVITVYDADDILCGKCQVEVDGEYGLMSVYGDDPLSRDRDEGAVSGDRLRVYLNGELLEPVNGDAIVWTHNGDRMQVDF
jgi:hypothetical protein